MIKAHIKHVINKVDSSLYQLYHLRSYTIINTKKTLFNALVLPHVNYYSAVLHGLGTVLDTKLERLINKGIGHIYRLLKDSHITRNRVDLRWLTHSVLFRNTPPNPAELLTVYTTARTLQNQSAATTLVVPSHRTSLYRAAFTVATPYLWNNLPVIIRIVYDSQEFRKEITH